MNTNGTTTNNKNDNDSSSPSTTMATTTTKRPTDDDIISVGRLVEVQSRTWPGINKPGGVARVTNVHYSKDDDDGNDDNNALLLTHVDVQYVLGNTKEKHVPVDYVRLAPEYEVGVDGTGSSGGAGQGRRRGNNLRDRSMLLGRCRRCGSLRTDCGSCDWATEEEKTVPAPTRKGTRRQNKKSTRRYSISSSSSSSSSEEDVLLQELLKQNQRKYRKYLRNKMNWERNYKPNKLQTFNDNPSSEEEGDEDLTAAAAAFSSSSRRQMMRKRRKRKRDKSTSRKRDIAHASVLESATSAPQTSKALTSRNRDIINNNKKKKQQKKRNHHENDSDESMDFHLTPGNKNNDSDGGDGGDDDDIMGPTAVGSIKGDDSTTSSSSESSSSSLNRRPFLSNATVDQHTNVSTDMDDYYYYQSNYYQEKNGNYHHLLEEGDNNNNNEGMIALSQFIQPEGREVAENLPQDIVDQTKNLRYYELPKFFDDTAKTMEDDWVPDWKFQVAKLVRVRRQMKLSSQKYNNNNTVTSSPQRLLQDCQEAFGKLREQLIRNGTDQCRVALHKLMDRRLYQKNRQSLSVAQRKQCRGSGMMDARNLRMDALDESVEDLVRKLRGVIRKCEEQVQEELEEKQMARAEESELDDDDDDEYDNDDLGFFSHDEDTPQEATPTADSADAERIEEPPSPVFHPHMHAQRVRTTKSQTAHAHGKKRSTSTNTTSRKRLRESSSKKRNDSSSAVIIQKNSRNNDNLRHDQQADDSQDLSNGEDIGNLLDSPDSANISTIFLDSEAADTGAPTRRKTVNGQTRKSRKSRNSSNVSTKPTRDEQNNSVPTFNLFDREDFFSVPWSERQLHSDRPIQPNRIPISQRMQAFLDANSGDINEWRIQGEEMDVPEQAPSRKRHHRSKKGSQSRSALQIVGRDSSHKSRKRPNQQKRGVPQDEQLVLEQENGPNGESENDMDDQVSNSASDQNVEVEALFSQLNDSPREERTVVQYQQATSYDVSENCRQLEQLYSNSPGQCAVIMDRLKWVLSSQQASVSENDNLLFLKTCLGLLQDHGTQTLQELITTKSSVLAAHVKLLSMCLDTLKRVPKSNESDMLDSSANRGALLERVLNNRQNLIDILVLQLVDSVYSLLHPRAWSLDLGNKSQILMSLCALRDSIARFTPLTETACRCILERLACQNWRRGLTRNHAFVSCIDSNVWKQFLMSGEMPVQPTDVRLQALGKIWPRVEIDTLWGLLAYLGQPKSLQADQSNARWQVLSKLFSCGVLAGETREGTATERLPPSRPQLLACEREICFFTNLLAAGKLDSLPSSDSVLVNLMRRSLTLQGDDYLLNPESSSNLYSMAGNPKSEKKFVTRLWKATHPLFLASSDLVQADIVSDIKFNNAKEGETLTIKNLLAPSSNVLKRCLELLSTWIRCLPDKKARQNRLLKALNVLRKTLVDEACQRPNSGDSKQKNTSEKPDSFEAAFAVTPNGSNKSQSEQMVGFFRESAAWLKLIEHLSLAALGTDSKVASNLSLSEIWDLVADDAMKKRQRCIMEKTEDSGSYFGDSVQLFTAAKVMASAVLLQLKVCPWSLDTGSRITKLAPLFTASDDRSLENDNLIFAVSCIVSCLDCLCDLSIDVESHLTVHLYSILTLVLTNMSSLVRRDEVYYTETQIKVTLPSIIFPSLNRCFKVHIGGAGGPQDSLHFRLLLCAIRAFGSFLATSSQVVALKNAHNDATNANVADDDKQLENSEEEDLWGSIDDDLLASMDLGGGTSNKSALCPKFELFKGLKDAIVGSKPSERFSIVQDSMNRDDFEMSTHGKHIVAKDVERVCDCLVSLAVTETDINSLPIMELLSPSVKIYFDDKNDSQFSIQVSQHLSAELSSLSRTYDSCRSFVAAHYEPFVFSFLEILLDSCRLEIFPSCNLERVREQAGEAAGEEALTLLDLFNSNSHDRNSDGAIGTMARIQQKRRDKADEAWHCLQNLGSAMSRNSRASRDFSTILGNVLQNKDIDLSKKPTSFLDSKSLEQESLECMKLLRSIISICSNCDIGQRSLFERVVSFSIAVVISHLLKVVQSLKYQESTGSRNQDEDSIVRRTKIQELLEVYLELLVSLVTWVLRENAQGLSERWQHLQSLLCDSFLFPVLRRQHVDLATSFHQILKGSLSVILNETKPVNVNVAIVPGKYLDNLLGIIMRRSRQILIASSKSLKNLSFQNYLVDAVIGTDSLQDNQLTWNLGAAFCTGNHTKTMLSSCSPLQEGFEEYICFVEQELLNNEIVGHVKKVKSNLLETIILPKLKSSKSSLHIKIKLVQLITHILDLDEEHNTNSVLLNKSILRSLIKGLHSSLLQSFEGSAVDDSFVSVLFSCCAALANSLGLLQDASSQNMIIWSQRIVTDSIGKDMADLAHNKVSAVYLWLFFKWLQHVGNLVVDTSKTGIENFMAFRKACLFNYDKQAESIPSTFGIVQALLDEENDSRTLNLPLLIAEKRLFPSKENNQNIVNVYAKAARNKKASSEDLVPWTPSAASQKSVKEFLAEFLSVS